MDTSRRKRVPNAALPTKSNKAEDERGSRAPKRKTSLRIDSSGRSGVEMAQRRGSLKKRDRSTVKAMKAEAAIERRTVVLPEGQPLTVSELSEKIDEKPVSIIKFLMSDLGIMASMTQSLDAATCIAVAEGFGKIVSGIDEMDEELYVFAYFMWMHPYIWHLILIFSFLSTFNQPGSHSTRRPIRLELETSAISTGVVTDYDDDVDDLEPRAPVVTIMGVRALLLFE
jgi:Translation initiation factor IF-2, N-terminal region